MASSTRYPFTNAGSSMISLFNSYIYDSKPVSVNKFLYFLNVPIDQQKEVASLVKKNKGVLLTEWVSPSEDGQSTHWSTLYLAPKDGLYCVQSKLRSTNAGCFLSSVDWTQ